MKTYVVDARYYIPAENSDELNKVLGDMGIKDSEYYGGYYIVGTEDDESEESENE